jgi:iron complex outermembrane receptor protein
LSWRITNTMEASLVGQNLLNPQHLEYKDWQLGMQSTEVRRGVYAMLSWTY